MTAGPSARRQSGFTLIELMVTIALSVILVSAIYFSLIAALESWRYSRNELALQQVTASVLQDTLEGGNGPAPGLIGALELTEARADRFVYVEPVIETHRIISRRGSIELEHPLKPGSGVPTAEYRNRGGQAFFPLSMIWENPDSLSDPPRLRPSIDLIPGGTIRVSYHPDPDRTPEALIGVTWDPATGNLYREYNGERVSLGKNFFGVRIDKCVFRYYDHVNQRADVNESGDVREDDLPAITAVEITLEASVGENHLSLIGMMMLRNSPRQSGLITLREDSAFPIANSSEIKTLTFSNFEGISDGDALTVEIRSPRQSTYRLSLEFEDLGRTRPVIGRITVEQPPGRILFSDYPRTDAGDGVNLLTLGPNGMFDYDDDPDTDDRVLFKGEDVTLHVTEMDIKGAACYIRP